MLCGFIFCATLLALTLLGYYSPGRAEVSGISPAKPGVEGPRQSAQSGQTGQMESGLQIFQTAGCAACHSVEGTGGTIGPALSAGALRGKGRAWIVEQIRNPKAHNPNTIMPAFTALSGQQVDKLVSYLMGPGVSASQQGGASEAGSSKQLSPQLENIPKMGEKNQASTEAASGAMVGEAARVIGNRERGAVLFKNYCSSCHGPKGTPGIPNPGSDDGKVPALNPVERELYSRDPRTFAANIDRFIQHGSVPSGKRPSLSMLAFGDTHTLTQQEIANVEAYVMSMNGVDRAQIINPGMTPRNFFILIIVIYVLMFLLQGGIRVKKNIK